MPKEVSAGAIIFKKDKEIKYLLLRYEAGHWDFPRGGIEMGEEEKETASREIREETGIVDINFVPGFREKTFWFYKKDGRTIYKEAIFYLAETKTEKVEISPEHVEFKWADYDEARATLTFSNSKKIMDKANEFLKSRKND